mgnify:CR=1 FL=1
MSFLGNVLWLIAGGLVTGALYVLAGLVLCLTVVGIPFGLQAIKLGLATMTPFGKRIVEGPNANSPLRVLFNLLWVLCVGWGIAAAHLASAAFCALTIIGIPFAVQHIKLIPLSLLPFGRDARIPTARQPLRFQWVRTMVRLRFSSTASACGILAAALACASVNALGRGKLGNISTMSALS